MREHGRADAWDAAVSAYAEDSHPYTQLFARDALELAGLTPSSRVLDVAAGTGVLALAAAETGARVLATDFSRGMVARISAAAPPNVEARVMDGQALDLPDNAFDAVFSIFGVIMFPDWRRGLAEMARVTRPGGRCVVATWRDRGAAAFLLLGRIRKALLPHLDDMAMPPGMAALSDPEVLAREMVSAGLHAPRVAEATHDYELDVTRLDEPNSVFGATPDWTKLSAAERVEVLTEVHRMAGAGSVLRIPATALIATATA